MTFNPFLSTLQPNKNWIGPNPLIQTRNESNLIPKLGWSRPNRLSPRTKARVEGLNNTVALINLLLLVVMVAVVALVYFGTRIQVFLFCRILSTTLML